MGIYQIWDFDDGPHYSVAIVEADDAEAARTKLAESITSSERESVWDPRDAASWRVEPFSGLFVLGAGCR